MAINFARMKKSEIVWMAKHRCKHGDPYLQHPACYEREVKPTEKIGYLDIETSNLHASFGICLCYAIKVKGQDEILSRVVTKNELSTCLDYKVIKSCIDSLRKFDRIITYYGSRFDIPFLRTRAISLGLEFPEYWEFVHNDMYYAARNRLRLHSNRLDVVCRTIFGDTEKTRLEPDKWIKALMGDKGALDYILDHCQKDTSELEKVHDAIINYTRRQDTSV